MENQYWCIKINSLLIITLSLICSCTESNSTKDKNDTDKINLWSGLKKGFDIFNKTKKLPNISFLKNGRHGVN